MHCCTRSVCLCLPATQCLSIYTCRVMASRIWAPAFFLSSLSSPILGFVALAPGSISGNAATSSSDKRMTPFNNVRHSSIDASPGVMHAAHGHADNNVVVNSVLSQLGPVPSRLRRTRRASACARASVSAAAGAELSMSAGLMQRWAEETFSGCSTVVSSTTRLSGLLAEVWETLADTSMDLSSPCVIMFPECAAVADARGLQGLYEHLEVCQDACERFGTAVSIVPHPKGGKSDAPAPALVVQLVPGAGRGDQFAYDPDWDDDWEIDRSLLDDEDEDEDDAGGEVKVDAVALSIVPASDDEVTAITKSWVQAVITDMGVCPFSVDASRAGLPVGQVRYPVTRETTAEAVYREYWREVELLLSEEDERALSTTLLTTPEFALNNAEAFEVIGQTLTQPLEGLHLEDDIQLVFFHPQYTFRDGRDRLGSGGAANFARRSPFPMINILRTTQVRLGQKSIPTGLVYKQNEDVLEEVGAGYLQKMLETRDWTGLEGKKIDRKRVDYYQTARKLQGLDGKSSAETTNGTGEEPEQQIRNIQDQEQVVATQTAEPISGYNQALSAAQVIGARESLATAAAESMTMNLGGGGIGGSVFQGEADGDVARAAVEEENARREGNEESPTVAGAVLPAAAHPTSLALTSEGMKEEDLKAVATALIKRLGSGKPLNPAIFEGFSEAVDRILRDTSTAP